MTKQNTESWVTEGEENRYYRITVKKQKDGTWQTVERTKIKPPCRPLNTHENFTVYAVLITAACIWGAFLYWILT